MVQGVTMPDITMCNNDKCPMKKKCKRHMDSGTIPSSFQSWSRFEYREQFTCGNFMSNERRYDIGNTEYDSGY